MSQKQNKRTKSWGALLIPRRRRRWNRFAFDENGTYRERLKCVAPPEHFFFRFRFENPVRMHLWQHWTWKGRCAVIISCRRRGFACVMLICFTSVNWFNLSQIAKMLITSLLVPLWLVKKGDFFYQSLIGLTWQGCHSATIAKTDDGFKCLMQHVFMCMPLKYELITNIDRKSHLTQIVYQYSITRPWTPKTVKVVLDKFAFNTNNDCSNSVYRRIVKLVTRFILTL